MKVFQVHETRSMFSRILIRFQVAFLGSTYDWALSVEMFKLMKRNYRFYC